MYMYFYNTVCTVQSMYVLLYMYKYTVPKVKHSIPLDGWTWKSGAGGHTLTGEGEQEQSIPQTNGSKFQSGCWHSSRLGVAVRTVQDNNSLLG